MFTCVNGVTSLNSDIRVRNVVFLSDKNEFQSKTHVRKDSWDHELISVDCWQNNFKKKKIRKIYYKSCSILKTFSFLAVPMSTIGSLTEQWSEKMAVKPRGHNLLHDKPFRCRVVVRCRRTEWVWWCELKIAHSRWRRWACWGWWATCRTCFVAGSDRNRCTACGTMPWTVPTCTAPPNGHPAHTTKELTWTFR